MKRKLSIFIPSLLCTLCLCVQAQTSSIPQTELKRNPNGFREDEENITNFSFYETYTLAPGVNSVILYGNVTFLACDNNSITELDIKHNPWLYWLECFHNNISGEAMTTLVNSLFDRRMESKYGVFCVIDEEGDGNVCTKAEVNIAKAKKWNVSSLSNDEYPGS